MSVVRQAGRPRCVYDHTIVSVESYFFMHIYDIVCMHIATYFLRSSLVYLIFMTEKISNFFDCFGCYYDIYGRT